MKKVTLPVDGVQLVVCNTCTLYGVRQLNCQMTALSVLATFPFLSETFVELVKLVFGTTMYWRWPVVSFPRFCTALALHIFSA